MIYWKASAPAWPVSRSLAAITQTTAVAVALAFAASSVTLAQAPPAPAPAAPAAPAAKPKPPAKKPPAKPTTPTATQPTPGDGSTPPTAASAPAPDQQVQLIYSPWTKFCLKGQEANAKQVCFTGKDARIESGMPVVAAVLIEPQGEPRKILRVTLPLGMQLVHGTRVIIDQNQPKTAPYVICFTNGCMADYEANPDMIGKMKKAQGLVVQAINSTGQPISLVLPLADFAGPVTVADRPERSLKSSEEKLREECSGA